EIFEEDLPEIIDSIRLLIRDDLASDPYYEYSTAQFDSLCNVMIEDIETRGAFLHSMQLPDEIPMVKSISISSCLNMGSTAEVELTLEGEDPSSVACVLSYDGQQEEWQYMEPDRFEKGKWSIEIQIPSGTYCVNMAFGTFSSSCNFVVFYPSWSMRGHHQRPDPFPSARVALADLSPHLLVQGAPLWCGENLWVLPVTNSSADYQDISFCRFSLGEPAGNVFLPGSILVAPQETFYLTNSMAEASFVYGDANIYGDAGTAYPAGTILELFDPSWNTMHSWQIGDGDSLPVNQATVIPCEISAAGQSDWIEIYNNSEAGIDLSLWYFMDSEKNVSLFPSGTSVPPGGLLLAAENPSSFDETLCRIISLDFGIDSSNDSLSLYSRLGDLVFGLSWNDSWPLEETGIMYLVDPQSTINTPESWSVSIPPGSPGMLNPGWAHNFNYNRIFLTSQNPGDGMFSFHYETYAPQAEAILYDLTGRRIAGIQLTGMYRDDVTADFRGTLPNGIYILYLRSSTGSASTRLTILN
ncbi:MAG: lamin tail domain-containing protein, partial [Candidatus Fermentibacteria bacterium]|nr:lamin tail domain-containing protein [Candidatus Fermentibacteria bacterium]